VAPGLIGALDGLLLYWFLARLDQFNPPPPVVAMQHALCEGGAGEVLDQDTCMWTAAWLSTHREWLATNVVAQSNVDDFEAHEDANVQTAVIWLRLAAAQGGAELDYYAADNGAGMLRRVDTRP
jgi:hypothetical protein